MTNEDANVKSEPAAPDPFVAAVETAMAEGTVLTITSTATGEPVAAVIPYDLWHDLRAAAHWPDSGAGG